jgi:hypothetical protein
MKPNVSAYSIGRAKRAGKYLAIIINGRVSESDFEKNRKLVPGPGAYLAEIQEKIILHDGAYKTPGGK